MPAAAAKSRRTAKSVWPADAVERRPVAELTPYARNARTHSEGQVAEIAASIKEWGWTMPVLVDEAGGIIAGHGRVLAAQLLGLADVPVMVARGWSEEQRRAYVIADNKLGLSAGWDDSLLALELGDLKSADFDLGLTGFSDGEARRLFGKMAISRKGETDPDSAPAISTEVVSKLGNVWVCGRHRVLCGDSCKEDHVKAVMAGDFAEVVFTDPPYGVAYSGSSASGSIAGDISQAAIPISFKQALDHATTDDARLYFCGGSSNVQMYYSLFDAYLRKMPALIIWDKGSIVLRRNNYHSQYEVIFFGWKGAGGDNKTWFGPRTADAASDIWPVKRDNGHDYLHPTQKPTALAGRAIQNSCSPGGLVYEPFSGSGSTLIACEMHARSCRAIELDPKFVDVAVKRWQEFTGETATLEGDGRTFAEISADDVRS